MNAEDIIEKLNLRPHPEGGWYAETLSSDDENGGRSALSAIYFLLKEGETAHWHRIMDAAEIWSWHAGSALSLYRKEVDNAVEIVKLGCNLDNGERPQVIIPVGAWQAASAKEGWVLASNIVAPGFDFNALELAPPGFEPGFGI